MNISRRLHINVTGIRTNGSPITQCFLLVFGADAAIYKAGTSSIASTLTYWATHSNYGGIVRFFVNIQDQGSSDSETLEFENVKGVRSYLEDWDESKVLADWSIGN